MTTLIENAVTITELAKHLKATPADVEAEALAVQLFLGFDWRGEPALSASDARQLVTGQARRDHDQTAAWAAHQTATEQWEARRQDTWDAAYNASMAASRNRGHGSGEAAQAAQEAARTATARFEKATPPPEFNGTATSALWYADGPGLLERVLGGWGKSAAPAEGNVKESVR